MLAISAGPVYPGGVDFATILRPFTPEITMTEPDVLAALGTVLDPEVGIDIVNLGLVTDVDLADDHVTVSMIMTSAACPMHGHLAAQAEAALSAAAGPDVAVTVRIVDQPAWSPERMSADARRKLGW